MFEELEVGKLYFFPPADSWFAMQGAWGQPPPEAFENQNKTFRVEEITPTGVRIKREDGRVMQLTQMMFQPETKFMSVEGTVQGALPGKVPGDIKSYISKFVAGKKRRVKKTRRTKRRRSTRRRNYSA